MSKNSAHISQDKQNLNVDIAIVGGGLAGFCLAVALKRTNYSVALIDAKPVCKADKHSDSEHFDDRALALSSNSIAYLISIGVLTKSEANDLTAIKHIHVSDKGQFGIAQLDAADVNKKFLGKVILARHLGSYLLNVLQGSQNDSPAKPYQHFYGTQVESIKQCKNSAILSLSSDDVRNSQGLTKLNAKLVVLAEGGQSNLTEQLGIAGEKKEYDQIGILANVSASQSHNNIAYERFTKQGPIALLPLRKNDYKLVFTVHSGQAENIMTMSDVDFLKELQQRFGDRAGIFIHVGKRVSYPMYEVRRPALQTGCVALIGNSAHTLHPIAGQGFNLGLRDIECLVTLLKDLDDKSQANDFNASRLVQDYAEQRERDVRFTSLFTDSLVRGFSNSNLLSRFLRSTGLVMLENTSVIKQYFIRQLIGGRR